MKKIYRVGVMGCADFADRSAIPAFQQSAEMFSVLAVASRSAEKAASFAKRFEVRAVVGYDNLLSDPEIDIVYMPLPTGLHNEWVRRCLEAGKHVLVEKSMADSYESARRMVELARHRNLLLAENFMFLCHRQMAFAMEQLNSGAIGELRQLRSSFGFPPLARNNFRFDRLLGGGALLDAGAYTVKVAQFFLGQKLKVKSASLADKLGAGVDTLGAAHLVGENGVSALIGFGFDNFYQCNVELWGSRGKLTATRAFTARPGFAPDVCIERQGESETISIAPDYPFKNLLKKIYIALTEEEYEPFLQEALQQARLIQHIKVAANA